ncbi:unannotated protein [freshwater metagenome]|uniref:Unannotated protein n=1 Tax=freshwater metagenome TaxID=449393 RepID=A0A6J6D1H4_9ZZZZ
MKFLSGDSKSFTNDVVGSRETIASGLQLFDLLTKCLTAVCEIVEHALANFLRLLHHLATLLFARFDDRSGFSFGIRTLGFGVLPNLCSCLLGFLGAPSYKSFSVFS